VLDEPLVEADFQPNSKSVKSLFGEIKDAVDDCAYDGHVTDIGAGWLYEVEECHGGREGAGETYWIVFSLTNGSNKTYWQVDGYYASYDGGYLDGTPFQVVKKEVMKEIWVDIKKK
jgi:hypothetical protein